MCSHGTALDHGTFTDFMGPTHIVKMALKGEAVIFSTDIEEFFRIRPGVTVLTWSAADHEQHGDGWGFAWFGHLVRKTDGARQLVQRASCGSETTRWPNCAAQVVHVDKWAILPPMSLALPPP